LWSLLWRPIFSSCGGAGRVPRRLLPYLPALLWALVLAWVGGASDLPTRPAIDHLDKLEHFTAYGVLGVLLAWGWLTAGRRPAWWLLLGLAVLLGAADEYRQSLLPLRDGDPFDWLADALGAAAGFFLAVRLLRRRCPGPVDDE
jgi:VanZ family protein